MAGSKIVEFVHSLGLAFRDDIWLVHVKHCAYMEKNRLISLDGSIPILLSGLSLKFSAGVVNLLRMVEAFGATIGPDTAIMKKAAKSSSFGDGFEMVLLRKKRRGGVLEDGSSGKKVASKVQKSHSWGSETGDTTESESINMEKKCLVEETSFDFGEGGVLAGGDHDQMPTSSKVKTKKALNKPLGKIDFSKVSDGNSILSDAPLELPPSLKNLVNVLVRKSFALDIGLDKMASNFS
ncbi:hypothetical protein G9A89_019884 [Geosiphon pyriformis]|nr:hypothetical protein G9A89_019884 [Geosiphon pyriformis]